MFQIFSSFILLLKCNKQTNKNVGGAKNICHSSQPEKKKTGFVVIIHQVMPFPNLLYTYSFTFLMIDSPIWTNLETQLPCTWKGNHWRTHHINLMKYTLKNGILLYTALSKIFALTFGSRSRRWQNLSTQSKKPSEVFNTVLMVNKH